MSSLSGGIKEGNSSYIKLVLYQSQFCENTLNIKNIFPYGLSIQFDNNQENYIEPIKNINEIFNSSQNEFKFFMNNNTQKHLIKINCFTKSIYVINKKFASVKIAINANNINKNNKDKKIKKWYYLKNKNGEIIIKLLLSIDILNISNVSNNTDHEIINKRYFQNENEFDNNISINKPNNFNIHFNSISNNNLNGIASSTYMSTSHYISSSNNSLKSSSTKTNNSNISTPIIINTNNILNIRQIPNNSINNNNLLSSIIEKDDSMTINESDTNNEKFGELNSNNIYMVIQNLYKKNNQKLFIKSKNLTQKKQHLSQEENKYFKSRKNFDEEKTKLKNDIKVLDKKRQTYENKYLDLTENYTKYENNFYKSNIEKDLNKFENEIISNINNICLNTQNLDEIMLEEKMTKNYFGQYSMTKNFRDNEKSVINNYYNNKGYSFESNNYKNSLYLYGNGGNSNKVLFNIMLDNKSIYNNYNNFNNNNFNIKPSPISFKYKEINKELSVSISNSNSSSPEKNNNSNNKGFNINNNDKNRKSKKRLITDYSKSTFNIIDDLYIFDEISDINKNKASKSNIINNNLALNIDDISNSNANGKTKYKDDNKKNNNILQKNNLVNKKNYNYNLATGKKKRKKIKINDDENNLYYHLEDKYYPITTVNNKTKNKDINNFNKKTIPKKIDNINIDKKDSDTEKCMNTNNSNISKNSYKSIIFKQKTNNNTLNSNENNNIKNNNNKNILQMSKKNDNENNNHIVQENNTINNKKKNNRVFKNIFTNNKKKEKDKEKEKEKENEKRKKNGSIITETNTNKSFNNSIIGINSILPEKFNSLDCNSRNSKFIQYNTNPNKNTKYKKTNRNCIQLHKKNEINNNKDNNNKDNLINHFYYNNDTKNKNKNLNKKISFYINQKKNDLASGCSSKIIKKKNTNTNINFNMLDNNLTNKKIHPKINDSNNNNKNIQIKKNNSKKIPNIDIKISFYSKKNKTANECDNKTYNLKKNNNGKLVYNKNINEYNANTVKNNKVNKINKIQRNKNHYCCLGNNSHLKPLINGNKNKKTILSLINSNCN